MLMNEYKQDSRDQIKIKEMGKTELYASFVSSIVDITSQRFIIQCRYNDASPDLLNVLQKQS